MLIHYICLIKIILSINILNYATTTEAALLLGNDIYSRLLCENLIIELHRTVEEVTQ
ncbi:MAG: hypothetical protein ACW99V_01755 [Candidatus Thorarchaeota archaeon]